MWSIPADLARGASTAYCRSVQPAGNVRKEADAEDAGTEGASAETPYVGIRGRAVVAELASSEEVPVSEGALVSEVKPASSAEMAGVLCGDVIVGIDDTDIRSMRELTLAVRGYAVGDLVTLKLYRDGSEMTATMTVGAKPAGDAARAL